MSHKDKIGLLFGHDREKPLTSITYSDPILLHLSSQLSYQLGYTGGVVAQALIQDINYISTQQASLGNSTTVTIVLGGTLGVAVVGEDITITVTATTTATDLSKLIREDPIAHALVHPDLVGTPSSIQVPQALTTLSGGDGFSADVYIEASNSVKVPRIGDWVQVGDIDSFIDDKTSGYVLEDVTVDVGAYRWARIRVELIDGPSAILYGEFFTKGGDGVTDGTDFEGLAEDIYFDNTGAIIITSNNVQGALEDLGSTLGPLIPEINRISELPFTVQLGRDKRRATNIWMDNQGVGSNQSPILIPFNAEIVAISATCPDNETFDLEIYRNTDVRDGGTPALPNALSVISFSSSNSESLITAVALVAGDEIGVYCRGTSVRRPTITIYINRRT